MADQVVLLTGATSGLGRWLAPRLGHAGLVVLVHGRDPDRVDETVAEVRAAGGSAQGYVADLARLAECRRLASEVAARGDLTILVNNAGVGFGAPGAPRELSPDGYELRWAVNYLAPVALTCGLLDTLRANAPTRIVNVGSIGQRPIDFDNLQLEHDYDGTLAYRRAKLALVTWSFDLARELTGDGVSVNCVHPATLMDTPMVRNSSTPTRSTVEEGGQAVLRLALDPVGTGDYYEGTEVARAHPDAYDPGVHAALRMATAAALG